MKGMSPSIYKIKLFRCLDRNLQLPHNNPMFCHSRNSLNSSFVMECCKDEDFCNKRLAPQLMPKPQGKLSKANYTSQLLLDNICKYPLLLACL